MPGFEEDHIDREPHPDSARYDEEKAKLQARLANFGFGKPANDIHAFDAETVRKDLAKLIAQIHHERLDVEPEGYDYNIADQIIDIVKPDDIDKKENK